MRSLPPGKNPSGKKQQPYWDCIQPEPRAKLRGWLAGPQHGTYEHLSHKACSPCVEMITEGKLQCELCRRGLAPTWRGYVPWYDEDYLRRITVISEGYYEAVAELCHLDQIAISRGPNKTDTVRIRREDWRLSPLPASEERSKPVEIENYLVDVLWNVPALSAWHHGLPQVTSLPLMGGASDNTVSLDEPKSEVQDSVNRLLNGDGKWADMVTIALDDSSLTAKERAVKRGEAFVAAVKSSKNGKHKPA